MIVKGFGSISGRSKKLKNFEVKGQNALKRNSLFLLGAFSIENEADLFEKINCDLRKSPYLLDLRGLRSVFKL